MRKIKTVRTQKKRSGSRLSSLGYLLTEGVKNIWSNRTMSFASVGVLVSCLLLTGAAVLFSMNVDVAMKSLEGNNSTTVYLQEGLPTLTSLRVGQEINGVDEIIDYSDIAEQLTSLDNLVTSVGFWIVLILSLVSLFIISNTIRVTMFSRRLEISIMKSVGATNWFVRVPFIVEGVIIGLLSGGVASGLLVLVYNKLVSSIASIPLFSPVDIGPITWRITLIFMLAGALFGALGGLITLGKYLKKEGGDLGGL